MAQQIITEKAPHTLRWLVVATLLVVSCAKSDPATQFRDLFRRQGENAAVEINSVRYTVESDTVAYDVRSTSSLISPYVAELSMDVTCQLLDNAGNLRSSEIQKWKVHYAHQDRQWVQKAYEVKLPHLARWQDASDSYVGTMRRVLATVIAE